jgi:chromate reductase
MITIIASSNRKGSEAGRFAQLFFDITQEKTNEEVKLLMLEEIPHDWFHPDMYGKNGQTPSLTRIQDEFMVPADKFLFVVPEYNGGFPGALKLFIDGCSVRKYKETFSGKKAALVGVASGRAGNLRGMEHLTGILNYLGTVVMPNKLPISSIGKLLDEEKNLSDLETRKVMNDLVEELINF